MAEQPERVGVESSVPESLQWVTDDMLQTTLSTLTMLESHRALERELRAKKDALADAHRKMGEYQHKFMDHGTITRSSYSVSAETRQKHASGGDFCHVAAITNPVTGEPYIFTTVGDVSDKGAPAAAIAIWMIGMLSMTDQFSNNLLFDRAGSPTPDIFWNQVNTMLCNKLHGSNFVAVTSSLLNANTGQFSYVRAGAEYVIGIDGNGEPLDIPRLSGMALGLYEDITLGKGNLTLEAGSKILFYTDGLTDQHNPQGAAFSKDNLLYALQESRNLPSNLTLNNLLRHFDNHRTGDMSVHDQFDDITFAVIQNEPINQLPVLRSLFQQDVTSDVL